MKVDFYVLESGGKQQAMLFACELLEKIRDENRRIHIHTATREEATKLDTLLWTYREDSFLPHQLNDENPSPLTPITIGYSFQLPNNQDLLMNFDKDVPSFFNQFKQIIEIVIPDPSVQQLARERYKQYREKGCELNTHKIQR